MALQTEQVAHSALVGGSQTTLHSHAGGGGGLATKTGQVTTNSSGVASVTFTTAFASTNYAISLTPQDPSDAVFATYNSKATTGFGVHSYEDKGQNAGNVTVDWIAIAYGEA